MPSTEQGYYQDADVIGYVTASGTSYVVQIPDEPEPRWAKVEGLSDDAERARDQGRYAEFEPGRIAYGIDA